MSPRSIYGETSNEGKKSVSTYPCRSLSGSVQENGVEEVVLVVIQITDDPSAERTAPPRSTHVRSSDVSSLLIQQGEGEVDGDPVARWRGGGSSGIPTGLRQALREEGDVSWEGEGGARA